MSRHNVQLEATDEKQEFTESISKGLFFALGIITSVLAVIVSSYLNSSIVRNEESD